MRPVTGLLPSWKLLVCGLVLALLGSASSFGQEIYGPETYQVQPGGLPVHGGSMNGFQTQGGKIGGMRINLPVVPSSSPRALEGFGDTVNANNSPASVASFIDSLGSKDAAFSVIVGQGRILTLKERVADEEGKSVVAIGDPTIADFQALPNPRLFRVIGIRPGVTDFSFTNANDETVSLEVHVTYDMPLLHARMRQLFPDAHIRIGQLREHLVVEGQVRTNAQATRVIEALTAYLESMTAASTGLSAPGTNVGAGGVGGDPSQLLLEDPPDEVLRAAEEAKQDNENAAAGDDGDDDSPSDEDVFASNEPPPALPPALPSSVEFGGASTGQARPATPRIINLLRVPGSQQVMLKVKIAELNRTAIREVGADILGIDPSSGNIIGTRIGGAAITAAGAAGLGGLLGTATGDLGTSATAFGIFPSGDWQIIIRALRQNGFVRVLAEPNLVAMSGHRANFLAGGEFPVPIPQATGAGASSVTVDFREFGVRLDFLPIIVDEDRIRLSVTPEVSTIDFTLGTTLVAGGDPVPGLSTRRANTTVEMKPGQTLAMAGLLQVELGGQTGRIPGLGDLPYIGPFFSNTTHQRMEKELLVLVTPHLVEPFNGDPNLPLPGDEVEDPTDRELYFENQFEGRTGVRHRSTVEYWPQEPRNLILQEQRVISGPIGFGR